MSEASDTMSAEATAPSTPPPAAFSPISPPNTPPGGRASRAPGGSSVYPADIVVPGFHMSADPEPAMSAASLSPGTSVSGPAEAFPYTPPNGEPVPRKTEASRLGLPMSSGGKGFMKKPVGGGNSKRHGKILKPPMEGITKVSADYESSDFRTLSDDTVVICLLMTGRHPSPCTPWRLQASGCSMLRSSARSSQGLSNHDCS